MRNKMRKRVLKVITALLSASMVMSSVVASAEDISENPEIVIIEEESITEVNGEATVITMEDVGDAYVAELVSNNVDAQGLQYAFNQRTLNNYLSYSKFSGNLAVIIGYTGDSESVKIPTYVKKDDNTIYPVYEIKSNVFKDHKELISVDIPDSVGIIGSYAFYRCSNIETIVLPEQLTNISAYAFGGCTSLKKIEIPESVTNIELYAFNRCTSLETITFKACPESGSKVFYGDNALKNVIFEKIDSTENFIKLVNMLPASVVQIVVPDDKIEELKANDSISGVKDILVTLSEYASTRVVTFDYNIAGKETFIQRVKDGEKISAPEQPEVKGYIFTGWYKDAEGTVAWDFETDAVYDNITIYACWEKKRPSVNEASLSLTQGCIGLNFYMNDLELYAYAGAYISIDGVECEIGEKSDWDDGHYDYVNRAYTVYVSPKDIQKKVEVQVYTKDNLGNKVIIPLDNESAVDGVFRYSVDDYLQYCLDNPDKVDEGIVELAYALRAYGQQAMLYFGTGTVDENEELEVKEVDLESLAAYKGKTEGVCPAGVTYIGSSLILKSSTGLRFYFTIDNPENYTYEIYPWEVEPKYNGKWYYFDLNDCNVNYFDRMWKMTFYDSESNAYAVEYSILSCCYDVIKNSNNPRFRKLACSMYWYYDVVIKYHFYEYEI